MSSGFDSEDSNRGETGPEWRYVIDEDEHHVTAVVRSIAMYTERDPSEVTPLHEFVDPDALETLFDTQAGKSANTLTFAYEQFKIHITPSYVSIRET